MDAETVAILVGCIVTVVGALAFVTRTQAKTAEKNAAAQMELLREIALTHVRNVETRLGELVATGGETIVVLRDQTAAINLLVSRFDAPPPTGGVVTATSEDETPPLGLVKPVERKPTTVYQFKKRGLNDK
jgi:hypothetical protein